MGSRIKEIHRRSYCTPKRKEGNSPENETPSGLKAKKVVTRKSVNSRRKIRNKLLTHMIVFGILNLLNMKIGNLLPWSGKQQKKIIYIVYTKVKNY